MKNKNSINQVLNEDIKINTTTRDIITKSPCPAICDKIIYR
jgi:hypothetical protein